MWAFPIFADMEALPLLRARAQGSGNQLVEVISQHNYMKRG